MSRAANCIEQLLGKYHELKLRHLNPSILFLQARVELAAGMKENACQTLTDALALSDEMGAHRDVWAVCWALSELEVERGCESAAIQLKERASQEVTFIGGPDRLFIEMHPARLPTYYSRKQGFSYIN